MRPAALALAIAMIATPALLAQDASRRVLVMPFDTDERLPTTYWLGEGTALALADALAAQGVDAVSRDDRVRAFEDLHLPARAPLTRATIVRVAQLMGASDVVLGSVSLDNGTLSLRARTLGLDRGQFRPEVQEQGAASSLFALCARLATALGPALGARRAPAGGEPTAEKPNLEAFEAYVKGVLIDRPAARVQALERAIEKQPAYDRALLALWDVHSDTGDHAAALAAAQAVTSASPGADRAAFLASLSLIELKRLDDAFTALKALADRRPSAAVWNNLGVVQLRRGGTPQTGSAAYYFNKAAELDVDDADVCFNLGYAYLAERDAVAAAYWLREAVRRSAADGDAHFVLGVALQASGAGVEGQRELELARHLSSRYESWEPRPAADLVPRGLERVKSALASWRSPQIDVALAAADAREQRELTTFYLDRARRAFEQQRDGDALADLRRALFLSPYQSDALMLMGRVHLRAGRPQEAIASLRVALWSGESADGHVALAEALLAAQDGPAARAEAMRAFEMEPGHVRAKALLAKIDAAGVR